MNVVYATNDAFIHYTATSIKSLIAFNKQVRLTIFYTHLSDKNQKKLIKVIHSKDIVMKFIKISTDEIHTLTTRNHLTMEAYLRLFIDHYMDDSKVLYIDGDTIVRDSLDEVYNSNIDETFLAAVTVSSPLLKRKVKALDLKSGRYFNSGVMLLNLDKIKKERIFEKSLEFIENNPELIEFADQDALNKIVDGNYLELSKKYNAASLDSKKNEPFIVHFVGATKPDMLFYKHPFKKEFKHYYKKTPFYSILNVKINKNYLKKRFKKSVYNHPIIHRIYNIKSIKNIYRRIFKKGMGE